MVIKPLPVAFIFFTMFFFMGAVFAEEEKRELVLIASGNSKHNEFTLHELRKIFLGHAVKKNNVLVQGIRNISNDSVYQVFLQKLMHLSARNYEKRILLKTFRTGVRPVLTIKTLGELDVALNGNSNKISYIWSDEVLQLTDIKIIQSIWIGKTH